jgi:hypothetical protein
MPDDLLVELETAPPFAASLENVHDLVRVIARELGFLVAGMKGSASTFEKTWRHVIFQVAAGETAEVQDARERLQASFEERLQLLKQTQSLALWLREHSEANVPDPDVLVPVILAMERLKADVFDRWQTVEDLEDLAARDYPLTTADLDEVGPHRRPPASWYAEESKPF